MADTLRCDEVLGPHDACLTPPKNVDRDVIDSTIIFQTQMASKWDAAPAPSVGSCRMSGRHMTSDSIHPLPSLLIPSYVSRQPMLMSIRDALDIHVQKVIGDYEGDDAGDDAVDEEDEMWRSEQVKHPIQPAQRSCQKLRTSAIHCMQQWTAEFELHRFTAQLAISYFDRYGGHTELTRENVNATTAACLFIASKMEDVNSLTIAELCDADTSAVDVKAAETNILAALNFSLHVTTPLHWLHWFIVKAVHTIRDDFDEAVVQIRTDRDRALGQDVAGMLRPLSTIHPMVTVERNAAIGCAELFLGRTMFVQATAAIDTFMLYPHSTHFYPSHIAAASMLHVTHDRYQSRMKALIERVTGYNAASLRGCTDFMTFRGTCTSAVDWSNLPPLYDPGWRTRIMDINQLRYTRVHINMMNQCLDQQRTLAERGDLVPVPSRHNQYLWPDSIPTDRHECHTQTIRDVSFVTISKKRKTEWDSDDDDDDDDEHEEKRVKTDE